MFAARSSKATQTKSRTKGSAGDQGYLHSDVALDCVWGLRGSRGRAERECPEKVGGR